MYGGKTRSLLTTYWLVICVFLLYQHMICLVFAFGESSKNTARETRDKADDKCSPWEVYDGVDCVCATENTARCNDEGGIVCDSEGRQFRSSCHFSLKMCEQDISPDTSLVSCGSCKMLRLTGGKDFPLGTTLAKFERMGRDSGTNTRYRSLSADSLEVFYFSDFGAWGIGESNKTGDYVAMVQMFNSSYPEDGNPGMMIPRQNGTSFTWESDSTYRLECVNEIEDGKREKRFIFTLIFSMMAVTAITTTTTLKIVQSEKGCLYYPSVCSLRDEIKYHLLPQVKQKKAIYLSSYGQPSQFESTADLVHDQVMDLKERITTISDLHTSLSTKVSHLVSLYSSLKDDFIHINSSILSVYNEWQKEALNEAQRRVDDLPLDILMTLPALIATSTTSLALAASGIGAVLSVAFAVVDIVSSVYEERKVRDELREKREILIKARENLNSAFRAMSTFQKQFCQSIVKFLYDLSSKGKQYDSKFRFLYNFISQTYGHSNNRCKNDYILQKSNKNTLDRLSMYYLKPLIALLSENIEQLRGKIQEVKEFNAFLDLITNKVTQNAEQPSIIFRFIKTHKPRITGKMFHNLFDLLKFISKSVLQQRSCYWGHNLEKIRRGDTTEHNYIEDPVCKSSEIAHLTRIINQGVGDQVPVCRIAQQVQGNVFRSIFSTVRYIADFVSPTDNCYWGYDLVNIRITVNETVINNAKIDSDLLTTLENLRSDGAQSSLVTRILSRQYGINDRKWQTFIIYHVWHMRNIDGTCPTKPCTSTCFPLGQQHTTC